MKKFFPWMGLFGFLVFGVFFYRTQFSGQHAVNTKRLPSNVESSLQSEAATQMNNLIFSVKTKDQVDPALSKIIALAIQDPDNSVAQLYAGVAKVIMPLKGILWRLRFIIEPMDVVYVNVINQLRMFKRNKERRGEHVDALFDYIADPNPEETILGHKGLFTSFAQFQDWVVNQISPIVQANAIMIQNIADSADADKAIFMYDSGLLLGENVATAMTSQTNRYRKVMPAHLYLALADVYTRLGMTHYLASYNFEGLVDFVSKMTKKTFVSKKFGMGNSFITRIFATKVLGPKDFADILNDSDFKSFLTLRNNASKTLPMAYQYLKLGVKNRLIGFQAMEHLANLPNQGDYAINARLFTSRPGVTEAILKKRLALMGGDSELQIAGTKIFTDRVAGVTFDVDISQIFNPSNKSMRDLKGLFANRFSNVAEKVGKNKETWKWNYDYGAATSWEDPTFGGVLPNTNSGEDYLKNRLVPLSRDASTRLLQTWLRMFM